MRKALLTGFLFFSAIAMAQKTRTENVDMDSPTFVPTVKVGKVFVTAFCDRNECDPKCEGKVRDIEFPSRVSNALCIRG